MRRFGRLMPGSSVVARCATWIARSSLLSLVLISAGDAAQAQAAAESSATARVSGSVFDSLSNAPLAQATVRLVLAGDPTTGQTRTTDVDGRFAFDSLPLGSWLATFFHPVADSLGLSPPVARLNLREASELSLALTIPRARTLIAERCAGSVGADTTLGYLYGIVRHSDEDRPLARASVALEWPEWVLQRRGARTEMQRVETVTDSAGWYAACGVPADAVVRAVAWSDGDSTGTLAVDVPAHGWRRRDFSVARSRTVAAVDSNSGMPPGAQLDSLDVSRFTVRVGRATLRGRVVDENGRPVSDAIVRLIGTGRAVRTRDDGRFEVPEAVAGSQTVEARAIGLSPSRLPVELRDGEATHADLILPVQRVALDTVRVMANRAVNSQVLAFENRARRGVGTFLDEDLLKRRVFRFLADALVSVPGVYVREVGGYGRRILMGSPIESVGCKTNIFVDGLRMYPGSGSAELFIDDMVDWTDVVGVEVYPRGAMAPGEYLTENGCGVAAVWTRQRFDGVSPRVRQAGRGGR